mgnify:CR=1 FL=1
MALAAFEMERTDGGHFTLVDESGRTLEEIVSAVKKVTDLVAEITAGSLTTLRLHPGSPVWASVKATEIRAYPA